jgi:hypothetical protein
MESHEYSLPASNFFRFLSRPICQSCVEDSVDLTHFLYTIGVGATLPSVPRLFASPMHRQINSGLSLLPMHALASWWWWVWRDAQSH